MQKGGEGDRGRERVRSAQVRSRPSRAHWGRRGPARLRTRTAKALWLPVRLGARARLSASVSRAGTGREDASTAVPNCGHQGAPEEEEEGGGGGERERGKRGAPPGRHRWAWVRTPRAPPPRAPRRRRGSPRRRRPPPPRRRRRAAPRAPRRGRRPA
ncbi:unnamed protein product, partial [Prorocentrum cordatum]